jgi:hypothetical protein
MHRPSYTEILIHTYTELVFIFVSHLPLLNFKMVIPTPRYLGSQSQLSTLLFLCTSKLIL